MKTVLILEDEALIAMSMQALAEDQGWRVIGPFSTVEAAVSEIESGTGISCALLDCNLGGQPSWAVADLLTEQGVPFAFTSGQSMNGMEPRFAGRPSFGKPIEEDRVTRFLRGVAEGEPAD